GVVSVPAGTPAGSYTIVYEICDVINPTNCDQATVTVPVRLPSIKANDNTYGPVDGYQGNSNLGNVVLNDTFNGRVPTLEDITVNVVTPATPINGNPNVPTIDNGG